MPKGVYTRTEEHKRRMRGSSSKMKGKKLPEEWRKNIAKGKTGVRRPDMVGDKNPAKRPDVREKLKGNQNALGLIHTEETKKRISESCSLSIQQRKERILNGQVKVQTIHDFVFELSGKDYCEGCGMTIDTHKLKFEKRFSMHCRDGNYKNLSKDNWMTLCQNGCHQRQDILDADLKVASLEET